MRIYVIACFVAIASVSGKTPRGISQTRPREFPYQASLMLRDINNVFYHVCSGTIIGNNFILTAAHCVSDIKPPFKNYIVLTGSNRLDSGGWHHNIMDIVIHPKFIDEWKTRSWRNDIAIIITDHNHRIKFNSYQSPINIASRRVFDGSQGIITGWDALSVKGAIVSSNILQKFNATVHNFRLCQKEVAVRFYPKFQICVKTHINPNILCLGDSGGSLVINGEVVGIASFINSCSCERKLHDIYTNVYSYGRFINKVVNSKIQ